MICKYKDDCQYYREYQNTCSNCQLKENGIPYCGRYREFQEIEDE